MPRYRQALFRTGRDSEKKMSISPNSFSMFNGLSVKDL